MILSLYEKLTALYEAVSFLCYYVVKHGRRKSNLPLYYQRFCTGFLCPQTVQ